MVTESPSLLLQRAAELIEKRAAEATDGPWRASGYEMYSAADAEVVEIGHEAGGFIRQEDAVWSATLNPAVAAPLVAWLRKSAAHYDALLEMAEGDVSWMEEWHTSPVFEFARLVVGPSEEEEQPT